MDDDTGWNQVLLELWSDQVRDDVVRRIEHACIGRLGWLARVFSDPDRVSAGLTETVHAVVLAAIRDETGADLEALGSQAAWDCYEAVWVTLASRWADGGLLAYVRLGSEPGVVRALQELPVDAAASAAAEVAGPVPQPLWLRGRLRVDEQGLRGYLDAVEKEAASPAGHAVPPAVRAAILLILAELVTGEQ